MLERDPDLSELMRRARAGLSPTEQDVDRARAGLRDAFWDRVPTKSEIAADGTLGGKMRRWLEGGIVGAALGAGIGFWVANGGQPSIEGPVVEKTGTQADNALGDDMAAGSAPASDRVTDVPQPGAHSSKLSDSLAAAEAGAAPVRPARRVKGSGMRKEADTIETFASSGVDEVALVRRVQRALARREARLALGLIQELDARVPHGRLMEERHAATAMARCMLVPSERQGALAAFLQRYPSSVHGERVEQVCDAGNRGRE